jgi:hypothetical protein
MATEVAAQKQEAAENTAAPAPAAAPAAKPRITTGIVGMWNGTSDGKDAVIDYKTGSTNVNPPMNIEIVVHDMRTADPVPSWTAKGYQVGEHNTRISVDEFTAGNTPEGKQFLHEHYFPEVRELVEKYTGSKKVLPYTFRLRYQSMKPDDITGTDIAISAVPVAHTDRDHITSRACVANQFGADVAAELFAKYRRFAQVNVWRPIGQTIRRWPLLIIDTARVPDWKYEDYIAPVHIDNDPRVAHGGTLKTHDCVLKHDPRYKYYYASDLAENEALIFSSFDSDVTKVAPHGAFWDNNTPDDAPHRRSIEVRTWAFFDPIDGEE